MPLISDLKGTKMEAFNYLSHLMVSSKIYLRENYVVIFKELSAKQENGIFSTYEVEVIKECFFQRLSRT